MRFIGRTGNTAFNKGKQYYNEDDYSNAWRKFNEAAGYYQHAMAQHYLGIMSENGLYVQKNNCEALKWYNKSAEQGNSISYCSIGLLYRNGSDGVTRDYNEALKWFEYSHSLGNSPISSANLGHMYRLGEGVDKDPVKALEYYKIAVAQEATDIYSIIGDMFRDGEKGIIVDYLEAELWYTKGDSYADSNSMIGLASLLDTYYTDTPNFEKALEWYKKAEDCGNERAQYFVGWYYQKGLGVKRNYRLAYEKYQKSARNGYAEAYAAIGTLHHFGLINGKPSYNDAREMYTRCIGLDPSNSGVALNGMGLLYQDGLGVCQSYTKAMSYFSSAVKVNNTNAYNSMGEIFKCGYGVNVDYDQAKYWFTKSAYGKSDEGQLNLGLLYLDGLLPGGIDYEKALLWFKKALRRGNERAQDYIDQTIHSMALLLRSTDTNDKDTVIKKMEQDMAILTAQLEEMRHYNRSCSLEDERNTKKLVLVDVNTEPPHTLEPIKNDKPHEKSKDKYVQGSQDPPKFLFVQDMSKVNHKKKVAVVSKLRINAASASISRNDKGGMNDDSRNNSLEKRCLNGT